MHSLPESESSSAADEHPADTIGTPWKATRPPLPTSDALLSDPRIRPRVERSHLVRHALCEEHRWVNFIGYPGTGRTTLLEQTAEELSRSGEAFLTIRTTRHAAQWFRDLAGGRGEPSALLADGSSERLNIIVDDLDLLLEETPVGPLQDFLRREPRVRIVSTTVHPIEETALDRRPGACRIEQVPSARLSFSQEETRELCARVGRLRGVEISADDVSRLHDLGLGIPLAVSVALDRFLDGHSPGDPLPAATATTSAHLFQMHRSHALGSSTVSDLFATLSLLPRFTDDHISQLFPEASRLTVTEVLGAPIFDPSRIIRPGEHVWRADYWHAASRWATNERETRLGLLNRLLQLGDVAGSFGQSLYLDDLESAERLLRQRFLSVFENLAPELTDVVARIDSASLRGLPMLALLQCLLKTPRQTADALRFIEPVARAAEKENPRHRLMMTSTSAMIAALAGDAPRAVDSARDVISEALDELSSCDEEDPAARRSLVESALMSALVLLECETFPVQSALPPISDSAFLATRFTLAWNIIARLRDAAAVSDGTPTPTLREQSYRSLIYSAEDCARESRLIDAHDSSFTSIFESGEHLPSPHDLPRCLRTLDACLSRVVLGDIGGALDVYETTRPAAPYGTILGASLMLTADRREEALRLLGGLDGSWGSRPDAYARVLRAGAMLSGGKIEAARAVLLDLEGVPPAVLMQAVSLLPADVADELCALTGRFVRIWDATRRIGVLRKGTLIGTNSDYPKLTRRELAVLSALRRGLTRSEIAEENFLSMHTVKGHIQALGKKLGARGQREIVRRAAELGVE